MASQPDLIEGKNLDQADEPDVGVLHAPKGWKDVPKVRAIMVCFV